MTTKRFYFYLLEFVARVRGARVAAGSLGDCLGGDGSVRSREERVVARFARRRASGSGSHKEQRVSREK